MTGEVRKEQIDENLVSSYLNLKISAIWLADKEGLESAGYRRL